MATGAASMTYDTVSVAREESFAVITLNRPPMNAINDQLVRDLDAALDDAENDDALRAVIITGAGDRIFSAGADLGSAFSGAAVEEFIRHGNRVLRKIERFPKPVIAAITGHALGGGCEISMACHLRILKETARMGQTESNLGIIPGYGGTQRMARLIGRAKALEHMILGTQITAPECLALGLVNKLAKDGETLDEAKAMARLIAKRPPVATRLIIQAVDEGLNTDIDRGLEAETRAFLEVLRTEDAAEGLQAFFQKREPVFKGR
jgi:enoyl-CoA hydratase/carnithine racemase